MSNEPSNQASTAASDPQVTKALAKWVTTVDNTSIPSEHLIRAKYLILDGIACALVGARLPWSDTAVQALTAIEPRGPCTLIGWEQHSLGPLTAAILNSTFIQGFELDDYHSKAPLHSNALLLPALFAAIESADQQSATTTGKDLLRAYVVGCEVGPRVGLALHGPDLLTRGWHSGAVQGPGAVAAAVSNLWGLSAKQTEWALGIACTQAGGLMSAQFGSMAKRMQHGFASRNGLLGAVLARNDYTGIEDVYEQKYGGFLGMFTDGVTISERKSLPEELVKGLGEQWEIEGVRVKLHAAMAALHSTIDCLENLQKEYPDRFDSQEKLDEISELVTEHSAATYGHGGWIADPDQPLSSLAAQMSIQYAAAAQLIDHEVLMVQFGADRLNRPQVRGLMRRVKPTHNKDFDEDEKMVFRTDLTVRFKDGREVKTSVNAPKGIKPAVSNEDVVEKRRALVRDVLSEERRAQIESAVLGLEDLRDVRELVRLLKSDVWCPIRVDA